MTEKQYARLCGSNQATITRMGQRGMASERSHYSSGKANIHDDTEDSDSPPQRNLHSSSSGDEGGYQFVNIVNSLDSVYHDGSWESIATLGLCIWLIRHREVGIVISDNGYVFEALWVRKIKIQLYHSC